MLHLLPGSPLSLQSGSESMRRGWKTVGNKVFSNTVVMAICTLAGQKQGNFCLQEPAATAPPTLGKGRETHLTELGEYSINQGNLNKVMGEQDSFFSVCTYTPTSLCADARVPLCVFR